MSLQISPAVTFVLWPLRFECLKHRESLTKTLFEHWLNISRRYKKQHGTGAAVGKRGSPNQILCTAITLLFCGFLSPVPMQINGTGFGYKDIGDLNAMHKSNKRKWTFKFKHFWNWVVTSQITSVVIASLWGIHICGEIYSILLYLNNTQDLNFLKWSSHVSHVFVTVLSFTHTQCQKAEPNYDLFNMLLILLSEDWTQAIKFH